MRLLIMVVISTGVAFGATGAFKSVPANTITGLGATYVGNALALTDDDATEMYNTPWPGGGKILFMDDNGASAFDLYTVPTTGTKVKTKVTPGGATYYYCDINPAGTMICFATGDDNEDAWEIGVMPSGGGAVTVITDNEATYGLDSHFPHFSGDGTNIVHVQRDWDTNTDRIAVTDTDGGNEFFICTLPSGASNRVESLDWLGTTNYIIYTTHGGDLYKVLAVAGSTPLQIGSGPDYHRAQSNADGSKIVAAEACGSSHQDYVLLNPDGSGRDVIVNLDEFPVFDEIYCQVCFTAAGDGVISLATLASNPGQFDIFFIDEDEYCGVETASLGTIKATFK